MKPIESLKSGARQKQKTNNEKGTLTNKVPFVLCKNSNFLQWGGICL